MSPSRVATWEHFKLIVLFMWKKKKKNTIQRTLALKHPEGPLERIFSGAQLTHGTDMVWGSVVFSRPIYKERLEISSRKLELPKEHFMQRWAR